MIAQTPAAQANRPMSAADLTVGRAMPSAFLQTAL